MISFRMNLEAKGHPLTMYSNWDFNSFGVFAGNVWGLKSSGIYTLFDSSSDNSVAIPACFEIYTCFNNYKIKKIRNVKFQYAASGDLIVYTEADDGTPRQYQVAFLAKCKHKTNEVVIGKSVEGTYWLFGVENVNGESFSFDKIYAVAVVTRTKW